MIFPHQFSTILEVDYDTPYDRHVIIEESFDTRNIRRKVPKIEDSFGDRIMRSAIWQKYLSFYNSSATLCFVNLKIFDFSQLSSKLQNRHTAEEDTEGVINQGYTSHEPADFPQEIGDEPNKSNWSYPFPPVSRRAVNG